MYGDLNGDDKVDVLDLQCMTPTVQWSLAGAIGAAPICLHDVEAADLDCNDVINVIDMQLAPTVVLGDPLSPQIDANSNGIHDNCE